MTGDIKEADIQKWTTLLRSSISTDRLEGASELANHAVRTRGTGGLRTRGMISRAAPSRLPEGFHLSAMLEAFQDEHVEVRRTVTFALGELADEDAVKVLRQVVESDPEPIVRGEAVDALGKIGGRSAVSAIGRASVADLSVEVRLRAIGALTALARAEPSASQDVIDFLERVREQDSIDLVKSQAGTALSSLS
jgi:HEAT repeats